MEEPVMKYAAVFLIVLSGVTFIYIRQHNMTVVVTGAISCTSVCKQNPTDDKKATVIKKRCVCETCFCHLLHTMIRFLKPVINRLTLIIDSSDVYLAALQEKAEDMFRYTLNTLNQFSNYTNPECVDDNKEKFTDNIEQNKEDKLHSSVQNCNDLKEKSTENAIIPTEKVSVANDNDPDKKTCAKCEQRGVNCPLTCPRLEVEKSENAASGNAQTSTGVTSKMDCHKCNVKGEHCPDNCFMANVDTIPSTSNHAKCNKCAAANVECLDGCPGEQLNKE